jgi:hypothetical protein
MVISKLVRVHFPLLALTMLLLVSLACGSDTSSTPQLANTAPPEISTPSGNDAEPTTQAAQPTQTELANTPTSSPPQSFKVGDPVKIGDSVLVVLGWSELGASDFVKPDEGKKFIGVDLLLVNASKSSAAISSFLQVSLKDNTGQKFDVDFSASIVAKKDGIDGELAPGERVRGTVGFQVPEEAEGLQFVFDASVFGTGKVFVDLGDSPVANEPPARLEGETEQTASKIGEPVQVGNLIVTVNEVRVAEGNQFTKPDAGYQFLVVDVTLENRGADAAQVSSALQMWLKDPTGQRYKVDLSATVAADGSAPDGELAAGEKLKGQIGYQVPEGATGLLFVFDGDVFGAGKVSIALP